MVIQELLFYHDDVVPEQLLRDFSKTTGNLLGASAPPDVSRAAKVPYVCYVGLLPKEYTETG